MNLKLVMKKAVEILDFTVEVFFHLTFLVVWQGLGLHNFEPLLERSCCFFYQLKLSQLNSVYDVLV